MRPLNDSEKVKLIEKVLQGDIDSLYCVLGFVHDGMIKDTPLIPMTDQEREHFAFGGKLVAVKMFRQRTGMPLKDSLLMVERNMSGEKP